MQSLSNGDWAGMERGLGEFYGPGLGSANYVDRAFALLGGMIPSCLIAYGRLEHATQQIEITLNRTHADAVPALTAFARLKDRYPLFKWDPGVNKGMPFQRGDFFTMREFRNLDVYSETFRVLGLDDHCAIHVPAEAGCTIFFGIERSGTVAFSERDRAVARLMQTHLSNARLLIVGGLRVEAFSFEQRVAAMQRGGLTRRQSEVCHWLIEGKTNAEIALICGLSVATVKTHLAAIFNRCGVGNRGGVLRWALDLLAVEKIAVCEDRTVRA